MPRDGSPFPPSAATATAPVDIGSVATPPFAVLPDPAPLFARRAARFDTLASRDGGMGAYLAFLAALCRAQHAALAGLPAPRPLDPQAAALAHEHGMPPLGTAGPDEDPAALAAFDALIAAVDRTGLPDAALAALTALTAAEPGERRDLLSAAFAGEVEEHRIAEHVFAAAAAQVHMARLAAALDAEALRKVTDGACPACGSPVVASSVVNWEGAANSRFCACPLCATQWHVPRVRCLACGSEKDVTFHGIEGGDEAVKAESCRACKSYVKIVYQPRDREVEPLADDVASLALDMLMRGEGYVRAGANPFLIGY